jgi:hypothetical protein
MRPKSTLRALILLVALSITLVDGCGGGGSDAEVVAKVAGVTTITKGQLLHWLTILAISQYQLNPSAPVPKGAISESPDYPACARFLAEVQQSGETQKRHQTKAQVVADCKQKYQVLKEITLRSLLFWNWLLDEGAALGIRPSEAEVRQQVKRTLRILAHGRSPEQTLADILFRAKVEAVELKLYEGREAAIRRLPKTLTGKQREKAAIGIVEHWFSERQWTSRTTCEPGYVMSSCSEYKE